MYLLQRSGQHIPYAEQKGAGHLRRASNFETCGQSNVVHHLANLTPDANFTASLRTSMRAFVWALVVRAPCHRLTQLTSGISAVLHTAAYRSTFLSGEAPYKSEGKCMLCKAFMHHDGRSDDGWIANPTSSSIHHMPRTVWDKRVQATFVGPRTFGLAGNGTTYVTLQIKSLAPSVVLHTHRLSSSA